MSGSSDRNLTRVSKLKSFHEDHLVQPEQQQQSNPCWQQHPQQCRDNPNEGIVEEQQIQEPVKEASVRIWDCMYIIIGVNMAWWLYV